MNPSYDVILAGAGPVGLFLACELALAACRVLILEQAAEPLSPLKQLPFGIRGLSAPTIEALDRRGLLEALEVPRRLKDPHAGALTGAQRQVGHFAGIPFLAGDVDADRWVWRLPDALPASLVSELAELETVLAQRAISLGVDIRYGAGVTGFVQTEASVTVTAETQVFEAGWLVGCDGGRSAVRKAGDFAFAGTEPEFTGYSTRVVLADTEQLRPGRNLTEKGMYLQSQPGYLMIQDFDGGAFHDARQPITCAHLQAVLRRVSGTDVTIRELLLASSWTDRARQATRYRQGRVLLAGDAAHIHSPLGGQGLNLGLGDALNLGWKLAATVHGHAPAGLLDSYQTERHPIGARVLDWSRAQVALMRPEPGARALNAVLRDLIATRDGATYVAGRVWGLDLDDPLEADPPLVGRSAPAFTFVDGSRLNTHLRSGRGLLLDFAGQADLKTLSAEFVGLDYLFATPAESFGLGALLIRPDGIVAWAGESATAAFRAAATHWFGPRAEDTASGG